MVQAGSAILDPANKGHWEQIQRFEDGTALLLHSFEEYAQTLAQNMRKTYLKPFTVVTDNMSESTCSATTQLFSCSNLICMANSCKVMLHNLK